MTYLEMARNESHGGSGWEFGTCLWSPTEKKAGAGRWPFWEKVRDVRAGDTIVHLRGKKPNAHFVGYSLASSDGFETTRRPPEPGEWDFAKSFYRADLHNFTPFVDPIPLGDIFARSAGRLKEYLALNRSRRGASLNVFFVFQSNRLQCLNGAYLSELDEALLDALFFGITLPVTPGTPPVGMTVATASQLAMVKVRIGQDRFSREIKRLYGNRCCFPDCPINDPRFLVAAHIARWSDNERLRGDLTNALCLCLMHDRAFELGLFTIDEAHRVFVDPNDGSVKDSVTARLRQYQGVQIRTAGILPSVDALVEHWIRVNLSPI